MILVIIKTNNFYVKKAICNDITAKYCKRIYSLVSNQANGFRYAFWLVSREFECKYAVLFTERILLRMNLYINRDK